MKAQRRLLVAVCLLWVALLTGLAVYDIARGETAGLLVAVLAGFIVMLCMLME